MLCVLFLYISGINRQYGIGAQNRQNDDKSSNLAAIMLVREFLGKNKTVNMPQLLYSLDSSSQH